MCVGLCGLLDSACRSVCAVRRVCRSVWVVRRVLCVSVSQGVRVEGARVHVSVSNVSACVYIRTCVCSVSVRVSGCVSVCLYMLW